jgi:hypothetical protein
MEADHNVAVAERGVDKKINREQVVLYLVLLSTIASFFVGFLLRENSIGGARFDFYNFHWPIIERFSTMRWGAALADYPSATNPLLYLIASLLPLHDDQKLYHVITFLVALLIWPLLSWAYHRRYSKYGISWLWASFAASAILISPGFRSSAFWGTTDYLPLVFCAGTSVLLSRFQDSEADEPWTISPFFLLALAVTSACAFYTRQFYAFVPVVAAWAVLARTKTSPLLVIIIFLLVMIPEGFLVYLWKGLNPPTFHHQFRPGISNVVFVGTNIGFLSTPLIVGFIRRSLGDVLPEWWGTRLTVSTFIGLFVFIMALAATDWPEAGGGIIVKAGVRMGALGTPLILTISYFGFVAAVLLAMQSVTNALFVATFVLPFILAFPTYQHYLEPSLAVSLFLFADTGTARTVFTKRVLTYNFIFSTVILATSIVYYSSSPAIE